MKTMAKLAIAAVTAGGLAVAAAAPANAADVHFGIGIGVPAYDGPYYSGYTTCYTAYGRPYYCGYPRYYSPGYVRFGVGDGDWHHRYWREHSYWRHERDDDDD